MRRDLADAGRPDRVAAHRLELGADQARAVGPAELLAEEAELGGAVAVAGGGVLGVGEAAAARSWKRRPSSTSWARVMCGSKGPMRSSTSRR